MNRDEAEMLSELVWALVGGVVGFVLTRVWGIGLGLLLSVPVLLGLVVLSVIAEAELR